MTKASDWIQRPDPPTLGYFFALDWLDRVVEKPWLGNACVRFGPLMVAKLLMFETGAVLAHALGERVTWLIPMLADPVTLFDQVWVRTEPKQPYPFTRQQFIAALYDSPEFRKEQTQKIRDGARSWLLNYELACGLHANPRTFVELYVYRDLAQDVWDESLQLAEEMGLLDGGLTDSTPALCDLLRRRASDKVDIKWAYCQCEEAMTAGVGVGAEYPAMIEPLWRQTWQHVDEVEWARWWSLGLPIEKPPSRITFGQRQDALISALSLFVITYYFDLADRLFSRPRPRGGRGRGGRGRRSSRRQSPNA